MRREAERRDGSREAAVAGGVQRLDLDPDEKNKPLRPGQLRMGTADEIVSLMIYLASDKAGYITGQSYLANGGRYFQ